MTELSFLLCFLTVVQQNLFKFFFRLIGILPFEDGNFNSLACQLLLIYYFSSSLIDWPMFAIYMYNESGVPSIDSICELVLVGGFNARWYLLLPRRHKFTALFKESRAIWESCDEEDLQWVRMFERKVRRLFLGILASCFFCTVLYAWAALSLTLEAARNNDTHTKYTPYKWFAEDGANFWPGYKINFSLQVVVALNGAVVATTVDCAGPFLIMMSAGYFRGLKYRFYRAYELARKGDEDSVHADEQLIDCSKLHQRILNHCSKIDEITRPLFFVQLVCTGYNTSLLGIKLAGTDPDHWKYLPMFILNIGQLFICQWAPDHLIDESGAISMVAYNISYPWMKRRIGKLLGLIIARAQRPVQMTAAGIAYLSLENFGAMLKGALSFFTMLRNFNV